MMTELLLASNNEHKTREFARLFPGVRIRTPRDAGIEFDFPEDGDTFFANAWGKAAALHRRAGRRSSLTTRDSAWMPWAASRGSCRRATARRPAVPCWTRRGATTTSCRGWTAMAERGARFVCCLVLLLGPDRFVSAQETVAGVITHAPRGSHGFGYDPLFLLTDLGKTMAELSDVDKDRISHRGRAARQILAFLKESEWT